ncbi:hypothetical protein HDU86_004322 [Geranomyces michiganensis]|nr:hypothetical protein HDU86_004322 [Geranomyces michiganensis]
MIRNIPAVRAVQFQLHQANDENAGGSPAPGGATPLVRNKKLVAATPAAALRAKHNTPATTGHHHFQHGIDKENTPMKPALLATGGKKVAAAAAIAGSAATRVPLGVKTPGLKAPQTALQGKSVNVRRPRNSSSLADQPAKSRTVSLQGTPGGKELVAAPPPFAATTTAAGEAAPTATVPRAILGQKPRNTTTISNSNINNKNTPRYLPLKTPQNKPQKYRFIDTTPKQQQYTPDAKNAKAGGAAHHSPDQQLHLQQLHEQRNPSSSRKSSAKRNSARALQRASAQISQQMMAAEAAIMAPAAEPSAAAVDVATTEVENREDYEIEYMPPRSIPLKYVPPDDMIIDHSVLVRPGLDTYISPAIRAVSNSFRALPEFDPRDLIACAPMLCPDEVFNADDIPLLELSDNDDGWDTLADCKYVYKPPQPPPPAAPQSVAI